MVNAANPYEPPAQLESQRPRLPWSKRMMLAVLIVVFVPSTLLFGVTAGLFVGLPLAKVGGGTVGAAAGMIAAAIAMIWTIYQYAAVIRRIGKQ